MVHRLFSKFLVCVALAAVASGHPAIAADPEPLGGQELATLHALIKRQPGESRWMEIDWHPSVWEGRQRAAAEGKPLFIMAGSGGAPAAGC